MTSPAEKISGVLKRFSSSGSLPLARALPGKIRRPWPYLWAILALGLALLLRKLGIPGSPITLLAAALAAAADKDFFGALPALGLCLFGVMITALDSGLSGNLALGYSAWILGAGLGGWLLAQARRGREEKYRDGFLVRKAEYEKLESQFEVLSQKTKSAEAKLAENARMYDGVRRILEEKLSVEDVLSLTVDLIRRIGRLESFLILTPDSDQGALIIRHAVGANLAALKGARLSLNEGSVISRMWSLAEARLYPDASQEPEFLGLPVPGAFGSVIAAPLRARGRSLALVLACAPGAGSLDAEDLARVRVLRSHLILGLQKAILYGEVEKLSQTDGLTGLASRRRFEALYRDEFLKAQRYGHSLGLVMADIDHFKSVNDNHGHLLGDQVLRRVGEILNQEVARPNLAGRYGGEEFILLFPQAVKETVVACAERLRSRVSAKPLAQPEGGGEAIRASLSLGVAFFPGDAATAEDLIQAADAALYQAKESGRNQVVVRSAHSGA